MCHNRDLNGGSLFTLFYNLGDLVPTEVLGSQLDQSGYEEGNGSEKCFLF